MTSKSEVLLPYNALEIVDEVLTAHGGAERWRSARTITARGRIGGLLPKRFPANQLAHFVARIDVHEQRTVLLGFPHAGQRAVLEGGRARIETDDGTPLAVRVDPRRAFFGLSGIGRNVAWDPLDTAYFAGYAFWNYVTAPLLLSRADVTVSGADPLWENGRRWRAVSASFPAGIVTHCTHQTFYIDDDGLIRRHDFVAEPVGRWASAALYCDDHHDFDGLLFASKRRVLPRVPRRRALTHPTLLALDFDEIQVDHSPTKRQGTRSR